MANIKYRVYLSESGWTGYVWDGETAGNLDSAEEDFIQSLQVRLSDAPGNTNVIYRARLTGDLGWLGWVSGGQKCGNTEDDEEYEEDEYIDMVSLQLLNNSDDLSISYRVYINQAGWIGWTSDGQEIGSPASGLKGISIKIKE